MSQKVIVASLYRCSNVDGQYSKTQSVLIRENAKIARYTLEAINNNTDKSGKFYVFHEELTELYHAGKWPTKEGLSKASEAPVPEIGVGVPNEDSSRLEIVNYLEANNIPFGKTNSNAKLIEAIQNHNK